MGPKMVHLTGFILIHNTFMFLYFPYTESQMFLLFNLCFNTLTLVVDASLGRCS